MAVVDVAGFDFATGPLPPIAGTFTVVVDEVAASAMWPAFKEVVVVFVDVVDAETAAVGG